MTPQIEFTNEELSLIHLLISQDTESSRVELHHTSGIPYRDYIKQREERGTALLKKMDEANPTLRMNVSDAKAF